MKTKYMSLMYLVSMATADSVWKSNKIGRMYSVLNCYNTVSHDTMSSVAYKTVELIIHSVDDANMKTIYFFSYASQCDKVAMESVPAAERVSQRNPTSLPEVTQA